MKPKKSFDRYTVRNEKECIEWDGCRDKDGYGVIGKTTYGESRAHRHVYKLVHGSIPDGMVIRHKCDNPSCCNVDHLVPGTNAENSADMLSRNRSAKGERVGRAKLTDEMVREIRLLYRIGITQKEIAAQYPVTQSSVSLIVLRKQWTHI